MPTLSSQGIGSGLDIAGIVRKIMAIEREPWVRKGTEAVGLQAQLSAYGSLKSVVSQLQTDMTTLGDVAKFKASKATSSDLKVLTASADATASRGVYAIEVKRLAETHRLVAGTVFADTDTTRIGVAGDTMDITVGTKTFTVGTGAKTIEEIRTAINSSLANSGVTASTLRDATGYHLTLSAKDTGAANFIDVKFHTLADPLTSQPDPFALASINTDRDLSGTFTSADLDAELKVENTFTLKSSSNSVTDVIAGLSLELNGIGTVSLNVTRDDGKIQSAVEQFIASYNAVFKSTTDLKSQTLRDERGSMLSIESQFRNALHLKAGTSSVFKYLAEIGVVAKVGGGGLTLNTTVFQGALKRDPDGVASMFADQSAGAVARLKAVADDLLGVGGILPGREASMKARIDASATSRANLDYRLRRKEASLNKQFNALDALVAGLHSTSSYLTTQLAQFDNNRNATNRNA